MLAAIVLVGFAPTLALLWVCKTIAGLQGIVHVFLKQANCLLNFATPQVERSFCFALTPFAYLLSSLRSCTRKIVLVVTLWFHNSSFDSGTLLSGARVVRFTARDAKNCFPRVSTGSSQGPPLDLSRCWTSDQCLECYLQEAKSACALLSPSLAVT